MNSSLLIALLMFSFACSKANQDLPSINDKQFIQSNAIDGLYPHKKLFTKAENHGKMFLANRESCKTCHGEDLNGGVSQISCNSCHTVYPHTVEFLSGKEHGKKYRQNKAECYQCHSKPGAKVAFETCKKCHEYPHSGGWAQKEKHGKAYLDKVACQGCHAGKSDDEKSTYARVTCKSCHVEIPHSESFKNGAHASMAKTYEGACTKCHDNFTRNFPDNGEDGCRTCHEGSLQIEWKEDVSHVPFLPRTPHNYLDKLLQRYPASKGAK